MSHFIYFYAECRYAECPYAECHYDECRYAEYPYAECRYTECRGAVYNIGRRSNLLNGLLDFSYVHPVVPEEADELDRVLGLVLDPQQRVVHVVFTTADLTPCDASLRGD
jgi:hypothetical protein